MKVEGSYNLSQGTNFGSIRVTIVYLTNGMPNGTTIEQTASPSFPNYSTTIMNMPQTQDQFWVKAKITGVNKFGQAVEYTAFSVDQNNVAIVYQLYP
jgi:hypothetical protein